MIRHPSSEPGPAACLACGGPLDLASAGRAGNICPHCGIDLERVDQLVDHLLRVARRFPAVEIGELRADSPWPPGGDSLSAVELMLALEKELGVSVSARDAQHLDTLGAALRYFAERLPQQAKTGPS